MSPTRFNKDDVISLLAWLDICIKHGFSYFPNVNTYLRQIGRSDFPNGQAFTNAQLRSKLQGLSSKFGGDAADKSVTVSVRQMQQQGSSCLGKMPQDMVDKVRARVAAYEPDSDVGSSRNEVQNSTKSRKRHRESEANDVSY